MEFALGAALIAGFLATIVMSLMMNAAKAAGVTDMPTMPLVTGSMMTADKGKATGLGMVIHFVVMGAVVFGIVYAALFDAFDTDAWWVGGLIGLAHGLLVGAMAMPMMPSVHPRMERQLAHVGAAGEHQTVLEDRNGEVHLAAPGVLGKDWGGMTPVGLVAGHVVYGIALALLYGWIA